MKKLILSILTFTLSLSICASSISQSADIVVAKDGSGDFMTIQTAIDASPSDNEQRTVIYIKRGLYNTEKLIVPENKINITLIGESRDETIISYHIYDCDGGKCPAEDAAKWTGDNIKTSATLTVKGDGFRTENISIKNTAGPVGQAQAITISADRCTFINTYFYGYQDTMYFWSNEKRSYLEGCLIVGRTDYIYGSGTVFFQDCEIRSWGGGYITAPSTGIDQPYGFVFNACQLTYASDSPNDDNNGETVRFGRPWHNYPKVAWLNCDMTEFIHPEGWGDEWNMDYASTSADLHLYEYNNTGTGADMSNRAAWVGIKSLTSTEALEYTVQKVLAGDDNWDPTAESQLVETYNWINNTGNNNNWLEAQNWDPVGVPANGELANVDSAYVVIANGDTFPADLSLTNHAILEIKSNSVAPYISISNATLSTSNEVNLSGKIATKDSINFNIDGTLNLLAELQGVHTLTKLGSGILSLDAINSNFSGDIEVINGILSATASSSLGKSSVKVNSGGTLSISNANALYAKAKLEILTGARLELNTTITISEFFIDETMQAIGEYTAITNPDLISGSGKIIIGRPDTFAFHRGANGNWDMSENFIPALIPQVGETVIVEEEIETTSTLFEANLVIQNTGNLRMRGAHTSTGTIHMKDGTMFNYNTGGTGMSLDAPLVIEGNILMKMESGDNVGSTLGLYGSISGDGTITALNNGKGTINKGTVLLTGDNSDFNGIWDLSTYSNKYPSIPGYISAIEGNSENAFGKGQIIAAHNNRVIFSHNKAAGDSLFLILSDSAKAVLNTNVNVKKLVLNNSSMDDGEYSKTTHPNLFEGTGILTVNESDSISNEVDTIPTAIDIVAFPGAEGHGKDVTGGRGGRVIYVTNLDDDGPGSLRSAIEQSGARIVLFKTSGTIELQSKLKIQENDITIAGQTAPGDGITLRNYNVNVDADNVIIRFLRFRMGDTAQQEDDALGGRYHKNIIVDHCSMSWSTDECVSFYVNENFTLQWCIISESLRNSVHDKGSHGYGGIFGGTKASFHHNLLAHHDSRNPRLGETGGTTYALTDLVDFRNNVIYNWQGNSCYGGEAMNVNLVNNYYKPGPSTTKEERIISIGTNHTEGSPIYEVWGKFYIDGNVTTGSERATEDNWTYGVYNQFHSSEGYVTADEKLEMRINKPHNPGQVSTHTAEMAYTKILEFCGASLVADSIDLRVLNELETGTATYMDGGNGSINGIIDTQNTVGGWPTLFTSKAPTDSDEDGMPDAWETANNLNPYDDSDAQLTTVDKAYPNIEVYINSLVSYIVEGQNKDTITTLVNQIDNISYQENNKVDIQINNTEDKLIISHEASINNVRLYSIMGQLLFNNSFDQKEVNVDVSTLKSDIYIVTVQYGNDKYYSTKIVLQ